jgi:hypothetical protein
MMTGTATAARLRLSPDATGDALADIVTFLLEREAATATPGASFGEPTATVDLSAVSGESIPIAECRKRPAPRVWRPTEERATANVERKRGHGQRPPKKSPAVPVRGIRNANRP